MTAITLLIVFAAAAIGGWAVVQFVQGVLARAAPGEYASQADESADETSAIVSAQQLAEWRSGTALVLGGVIALLIVALAPRLFLLAFVVAPVVGWIGYHLPVTIVRSKARRRVAKFEGQFLDALGSLRNGLRSGRSILQCLESVAREMDDPLGAEFSIFLRQHRMGRDITECAELFRKRIPSEDLGLVLTCIQINQKVGGNLSDVLERIEETVRARFQLRDKVESLTSQGQFEGYIMAAAPFVIAGLLFFLDRELMTPLFTDPIGWCAWGAIAVLETIAFIAIKIITTVEA